MGMYREQDPLAAFIKREQSRVLERLMQFADGEGRGVLADARDVLRALAAVETEVLYPAFSRVRLRLETERLLDDSRGDRAEQLAGLDVLAHKRAARSRKLAAVKLIDLIKHHDEQLTTLLIPVLASQLPRPLYHSIVHAFIAHYEGKVHQGGGAERRQPSYA